MSENGICSYHKTSDVRRSFMRRIRQTLLGLAVICLIIGFGCTVPVSAGSYSDPVNVSIPYTHDYKADSKRTGDVFTYQVTPKSGAPAPDKSTFDVKADPKKSVTGDVKLKITFPKPGSYLYSIKVKSGPSAEGITLDKTVYTVQVLVKNASNGGLAVKEVRMTSNKSDKKQAALYFKPSYTAPPAVTRPISTPDDDDTATPARTARNAANPAAAPAQAPAAPVDDAPVDVAPDFANIGDDEGPQAAPDAGVWAILNLLLMIATILIALILAVRFFGRVDTDEDEYVIRRGGKLRLGGIVFAVASVVTFLLTETIPGNRPVLTDEWTPFMALIFVLAAVLGFAAYKHYSSGNDEQMAGA